MTDPVGWQRILLISDTHGQIHPEIAAMATSCDAIVHAGDVGAAEILTLSTRTEAPVLAVRGNNDTPEKWPDHQQTQLRDLRDMITLELAGGGLVVEHGDNIRQAGQRHARLRERHHAARLVVYGHSHRLVIDRQASPWVVNPGAAGRSRTFGGSSCILLSIDDGKWRLQTYRFELSNWPKGRIR